MFVYPMRLREMKEYLINMRRFRQSLVALQLIAASEANAVRAIREKMFYSTLFYATIHKHSLHVYPVAFPLLIPLTLALVGCGLHNTSVLRTTLNLSAKYRKFRSAYLVFTKRTQLFLLKEYNTSLILQVAPIFKYSLSYLLGFLIYQGLATLPQYLKFSHFIFIFNMCQSDFSVRVCCAKFASTSLFVVAGLDFTNAATFLPHFISSFILLMVELLKENYNAGALHKVVSLTDAVNNCDSILKELSARYNRLRQESITNALLELSSFLI